MDSESNQRLIKTRQLIEDNSRETWMLREEIQSAEGRRSIAAIAVACGQAPPVRSRVG
jgi:hypothetical protein